MDTPNLGIPNSPFLSLLKAAGPQTLSANQIVSSNSTCNDSTDSLIMPIDTSTDLLSSASNTQKTLINSIVYKDEELVANQATIDDELEYKKQADVDKLFIKPKDTRLDESQGILDYLFASENIMNKYDDRCSSLNYFNNTAFGKATIADDINNKVAAKKDPSFIRRKLNEMPQILAEKKHSDFRYVLLNTEQGQIMLFSASTASFKTGHAMSHSHLACGKEAYSKCIAAGEIYFTQYGDTWYISKLSNKSGHFSSSIQTLIAPLIFLLQQNTLTFAPQVTFDLVNNQSSVVEVNVMLKHIQEYYNLNMQKIIESDNRAKSKIKTPPTDSVEIVVIKDEPTPTLPRTDHAPVLVAPQSMFNARAKHKWAAIDTADTERDDEVIGDDFIPRARH